MQIEVGSDRYREIFGDRFEDPFQSRLPGFDVLVSALSDPSIDPDQIEEIRDGIARARSDGTSVLMSLGSQDFLKISQYALNRIVRQYSGGLSKLSAGIPSYLGQAFEIVARQGWEFGSAIADDTLDEFLIESAWAGGMQALGAIGPIGKIAAAIAGFGREIYRAFQQREIRKDMQARQRQAEAFSRMPPLQQNRKETDDWYLNSVVLTSMETGNWTRLFSPRFDPTKEWRGIERNGGFAFAPGNRIKGSTDEFGREVEVFETAKDNGVGMVPGLDFITSVVQVSLDPMSPVMDGPRKGSLANQNWPIKPSMVQDVGKFYINTGRLCAVAWSWATVPDASPHLYKIDVGLPSPLRLGSLHAKWSSYCALGLDYLRKNADDWENNAGKGRVLSGNLEYLYGSAIACAIGTWTCTWNGGTTLHPTFRQFAPGFEREQMNSLANMHPDAWLGCVMPPQYTAKTGEGQPCLRSLYETHIRPVLVEVRRRQEYFLRHSLVCAYVREGWDCFQDPKMLDLLRKQRQLLLVHPDRHLVVLDDVPNEEPFDGGDFRTKLIASGVKRRPPFLAGGGGRGTKGPPGTLEPTDAPPPVVPPSEVPMPFAGAAGRCGPACREDKARVRQWTIAAVGGTAAAAAGYYLWKRSRKEMGR